MPLQSFLERPVDDAPAGLGEVHDEEALRRVAAVPDVGRYDDIPHAPAGLGLPPLPGAMLRPVAAPGLGADLVAALAGLAAGR